LAIGLRVACPISCNGVRLSRLGRDTGEKNRGR
jgi:hypothetical protein